MGCEGAEVDRYGCRVKEVCLVGKEDKTNKDISIGLKFQVADVKNHYWRLVGLWKKGMRSGLARARREVT